MYRESFQFSKLSFLILATTAFLLVGTANAQERRKFDVKEYLSRIDRNGNGVLEPNEMSGRTGGFVKSLGFDPSSPVKIQKIVSKVNNDRKSQKSSSSKKSSVVAKVPGFGVSESEEREGVNDFSASIQSNNTATLEQQYGEKVMERVMGTMRRYDKNGNGRLDANEVKDARWGSPSPQESDTNRDGALSKSELARRYVHRERERNKASNRERVAADKASRDRLKFRSSSNPTSNRTRSFNVKVGSTSSNNKKAFNSGNDRYAKYAEGLIKNYDKNKDGKLDSRELKDMRRPPQGADTNKDGFVTASELATSLSGKSSPSSSSSGDSKRSSSSNERKKKSNKFASSNGSSSSKVPSSLAENDANGDGQLQMHEFSSDWDGDVLAAFQRRDLNGDGVITVKEWNATR